MKPSGIEWIGDIPDDWEICRLKRVCKNILTGKTPPGAKEEYYNATGLAWFTPSDLGENLHINKARRYLSIEGEKFVKRVPRNSILMVGIGDVGRVCLTDIDCSTNQQINAIICDERLINSTFLALYLYSIRYHISKTAKYTILPIINQKETKNIIIPLPPLETQTRIAKYLDEKCTKIDYILSGTRELIEDYKKLKAAVIHEAVTKGNWEQIRLKYVAKLKGRIGWHGLKSSEYQNEGAYLITGTDFVNGVINWDSCVHISEERYNEDELLHVREGDLLITKDGTIGKLAIVKNCPEQATLNTGVMYIRSKGTYEYSNKFLYYVLMSQVFWNWYNLSQRGNSTIKHLYQSQFYNFPFPFPPFDEQTRIADYLDKKCSAIDSIISNKQNLLRDLESYKRSLIYECVTGKRTVN